MPSARRELEIPKLVLQQAIETYRVQMTLLIQLITVLVLANVTLIGYAFTSKFGGLLLVGPLFPSMIYCAVRTVFRLSTPIVYAAVTVEQECPPGCDTLMATFLGFAINAEYVEQLRAISRTSDFSERMQQLRELRTPVLRGPWIIRASLAVVAIGQPIMAFVTVTWFGWRLL